MGLHKTKQTHIVGDDVNHVRNCSMYRSKQDMCFYVVLCSYVYNKKSRMFFSVYTAENIAFEIFFKLYSRKEH